MKKIISFLLCFLLLTTLTACTDNSNKQSNNCYHDWVWDYSTATCNKNGYAFYVCLKCHGTKKEYINAYGCHDYDYDGYCNDCLSYIGGNSSETDNNNQCSHTYTPATCTQAKKCSKCGTTIGNPLGHNYSSATCTKPKTCTRCYATTGTALGHSYSDATCSSPKTCVICGITNGSTLEHSFYWGKCSACGSKDSDYFLTYSFGDTFDYDSASGKVRITISNTYTVQKAHSWLISQGYATSGYVVRVPITIKNIDTETGGLNSFNVEYFSSNGTKSYNNMQIVYDDMRAIYEDSRPNGVIVGAIYFIYTGDGVYAIEFDDTSLSSITVELNVKK